MAKVTFQGPITQAKNVADAKYIYQFAGSNLAELSVSNDLKQAALLAGGDGKDYNEADVSQGVKDMVAAYGVYLKAKHTAEQAQHPKPTKAEFNARKQ